MNCWQRTDIFTYYTHIPVIDLNLYRIFSEIFFSFFFLFPMSESSLSCCSCSGEIRQKHPSRKRNSAFLLTLVAHLDNLCTNLIFSSKNFNTRPTFNSSRNVRVTFSLPSWFLKLPTTNTNIILNFWREHLFEGGH